MISRSRSRASPLALYRRQSARASACDTRRVAGVVAVANVDILVARARAGASLHLRRIRSTGNLPALAVAATLWRMVARGQDGRLSQMRRGTLQYCVLALLANEERYAFELVRRLSDVDGMVTSEGTIYPLLSRLRRDGLVESVWRESAE